MKWQEAVRGAVKASAAAARGGNVGRQKGHFCLEAPVHGAAFGVVQPTPFVEIANHVDGMNEEHAEAVARGGRVAVFDAHGRVVEGEPAAVKTACDVDVFGVHEEAFVEESFGLQGFAAHKQERAGQKRRVDDFVVVGALKQEAAHAPLPELMRQKPFYQ